MLVALIRKDLLLELRTKESLSVLVATSILLSTLVSYGVQGSFIEPETVGKLYPTLFWLICIFASTLSISRSFEYEAEGSAMEGVLLTGVSPSLIFLSKFLINFILSWLGYLIIHFVLAGLLGVTIKTQEGTHYIVTGLFAFGYSALATLLAAMTVRSRLRGALLPLILLPILFPLLFAAIGISQNFQDAGSLDFASFSFSLLVGLDVVYFLLGINLFHHVISE